METFDDIFAAFGGPTKLAREINILPEHAIVMKHRGSIPAIYWPDIVEAARRKHIRGVTFEALVRIGATRRDRRA